MRRRATYILLTSRCCSFLLIEISVHQRYARDLDTSQTTHLIALVPEGAKYETALSCRHIDIVSPAWLEACLEKKSRVDEHEYRLVSVPSPPHNNKTPLRDLINEQLIQTQQRPSMIFSSCHFLLLGFEKESDLKTKLSRLIRWGMGTIYWELNESITHVIVSNECEDEYRYVLV